MPWKVTTGPASEPMDTDEVKLWLKVDTSADDTLISGLITAARKHVERYTGISLLSQTVQQTFDKWPDSSNKKTPNGELKLSVSPLISVTSVSYLDTSGQSQVLASSNYVVDTLSFPSRIAPTINYDWPETYNVINAITVTYTAGYSATTDGNFPSELLTAMKLWIAGLYEVRQDYAKRYKNTSTVILDTVKIRNY